MLQTHQSPNRSSLRALCLALTVRLSVRALCLVRLESADFLRAARSAGCLSVAVLRAAASVQAAGLQCIQVALRLPAKPKLFQCISKTHLVFIIYAFAISISLAVIVFLPACLAIVEAREAIERPVCSSTSANASAALALTRSAPARRIRRSTAARGRTFSSLRTPPGAPFLAMPEHRRYDI